MSQDLPGVAEYYTSPFLVQSSYQFQSLAAGEEFVCGVLLNSSIYCWGASMCLLHADAHPSLMAAAPVPSLGCPPAWSIQPSLV